LKSGAIFFIVPTLCAHRYTQVYFGRDVQDKSWTPESKIYFYRSHALRGNACLDAPRPATRMTAEIVGRRIDTCRTRSVRAGIPTLCVGMPAWTLRVLQPFIIP
jgi:hypothetical protein